jgi:hypothetical protein
MVVRQQINQHAPAKLPKPPKPREPSIRAVDRRRRGWRFGLFYALPLAEPGARPTRLNVRIRLWHTSDMNRLPPTFEHYCQAMLHHSEAHGYRLTDAGGFIADLNSSSLHGGDCKLPLNEGQIRPLLAQGTAAMCPAVTATPPVRMQRTGGAIGERGHLREVSGVSGVLEPPCVFPRYGRGTGIRCGLIPEIRAFP